MNKLIKQMAVAVLLLVSAGQATAVLSEYTYNHLTAIQKLMNDGQYIEARDRLAILRSEVKNRTSDFAAVLQTSASVYAALSDYQQALHSYEQWLATVASPSAENLAFVAMLYAHVDKDTLAAASIHKAIAMTEFAQEDWYQLLLAMQYRQQQFIEAAHTLELMIALFPDNSKYWQQLSSVYFHLHDGHKSLAVLELAHKRGFLTTEKLRMNLVDLYLHQNIPYKAAALLHAEMQAGSIAATDINKQKLTEIWLLARESELP